MPETFDPDAMVDAFVRPIEAGDIPGIVMLRGSLLEKAGSPIPHDEATTRALCHEALAGLDTMGWVVAHGRTVVGMLIVSIGPSPINGRVTIAVQRTFYIAEEARKWGYATQLLLVAKQWARAHGARWLAMTLNAQLGECDWLRKRGFTVAEMTGFLAL